MEEYEITKDVKITWSEEEGYRLWLADDLGLFNPHGNITELTEKQALRLYAFLSRTFDKL